MQKTIELGRKLSDTFPSKLENARLPQKTPSSHLQVDQVHYEQQNSWEMDLHPINVDLSESIHSWDRTETSGESHDLQCLQYICSNIKWSCEYFPIKPANKYPQDLNLHPTSHTLTQQLAVFPVEPC